MLKYREEQNHRWAHNLKAAREYFNSDLEKFYNGDIPAEFPYPGIKILGAFWVAENMEMQERLAIHKDVLDLKEHYKEYEVFSEEFYRWFVEDFVEMSNRFDIYSKEDLDQLVRISQQEVKIPEDWQEQIESLEARSEEMLSSKQKDDELLRDWFFYCGRFILSYAQNLIRQGVITALFVKYFGVDALKKAIEPTIDYFGWNINRVFFNVAMPATGFQDLGDIVALGAYGMLADQAVSPSSEEVKDGVTYKRSYLDTCQLYGFIDSVADFLNQPKGCTSDAYCRFCVGHGEKTMHFVIPPDRTVDYSLETGLGYGGKRCTFLLKTVEGEDDERCANAEAKIFGDEELTYK